MTRIWSIAPIVCLLANLSGILAVDSANWETYLHIGWDARTGEFNWEGRDRCLQDRPVPQKRQTVQHIVTTSDSEKCTLWHFKGRIEDGTPPVFYGRIRDPGTNRCLTYYPYNGAKPAEDRGPVNRNEKNVYGDMRSAACDDRAFSDEAREWVIPLKDTGLPDYFIRPATGPNVGECTFEGESNWNPTIFMGTDRDSRVEVGCGRTAWRFWKRRPSPFNDLRHYPFARGQVGLIWLPCYNYVNTG